MRGWTWLAVGAAALLALGGFMLFPRGRAQVEKIFGKFVWRSADKGRITIDPDWIAANILPVALGDGKIVRVHRLVAAQFVAVYNAAIAAAKWAPQSVQTFVPRHVRWDVTKPLSLHSWGIAFDVDPGKNPYGNKPSEIEQHPEFVATFEAAGWTWGGRWKAANRDKMHFQAAGV